MQQYSQLRMYSKQADRFERAGYPVICYLDKQGKEAATGWSVKDKIGKKKIVDCADESESDSASVYISSGGRGTHLGELRRLNTLPSCSKLLSLVCSLL